jgi:UDP-GlcNAc:undecaprenyl-phosphate GlcNAc-1-phosphate transferase
VPWVIAFAGRLGAIDAPDGFRKIGHAATPRMGGLAVMFGFACALLLYHFFGPQIGGSPWSDLPIVHPLALAALVLILTIGVLDDRRGMRAGAKLLGQTAAAVLLYYGGFRIDNLFLFGVNVDLGWLSLPATCFWFIGCMNVWNLIDGMDGLASGVGAIVCGTLMVAAAAMAHLEVSYAAAALAGALAGFLVFNFHPARIFLGDTGSLFLGAMLGMLAIRGSLKSGMTVAILAPILAMGLPIIDTLLAILRRWVRRMPWSAPDRGHLHHRLIAFGLTTRQASMFLYSFTLLLCAAALASLALQSDSLALAFAVLGSVGLAAVFAARREQRDRIVADFRERINIRRLEQRAASTVWEGVQRLSHCHTPEAVVGVAERVASGLGCDYFRLAYRRDSLLVVERRGLAEDVSESAERPAGSMHERSQIRLAVGDWPGEELLLELQRNETENLPLLVAGPFLQRFARELIVRLRAACAEAVHEQTVRRDRALAAVK